MNTRNISEAPTFPEFLGMLEHEEQGKLSVTIGAYDLQMTDSGKMRILNNTILNDNQNTFQIGIDADMDLANLCKIDFPYIEKLNKAGQLKLKAQNFNERLHFTVGEAERVRVSIQNDKIDTVQKANLAEISRLGIIKALGKGTPREINIDEAKILVYYDNGKFDISMISPGLIDEPTKGDAVAFGVSLIKDREGSIQVGGAIYRLVCCNGAIARECSTSQERIRRPNNRNEADKVLYNRISHQCEKEWDRWNENAEGLKRLAQESVTREYIQSLASRLMQKPYFMNAAIAKKVVQNVLKDTRSLSLYSLFNAITDIGTHDPSISDSYSYRLRLDGGILARSRVCVCETCHQLVVNDMEVK